MKILYLLSQRPDSTGSGIYLRALMAQARAAGHEVEALVGVNASDEAEGCRYQLRFGLDVPFAVVGMSDVMPYPSLRWSELSPSDLASYQRAFGRLLDAAIGEFEPDIVHSNHLWHLTSLAAGRGLSVLATCHGSCLRQLALTPRLRPNLDRVHTLVALSAEQGRVIEAEYGRRPAVVPPGFDQETFAWSAGPREGVLYAGKLSLSKGVGELLESWDGPLTLAGGGSGQEADALRARAGERAVGPLSAPALAAAMQGAQVFCLPSFYEGLPLVVLEAVACGCRVVVNDLPGLSGWLQPEWLDSGRVRLVELPPMVGPDRPAADALPAYRQRLRAALQAALEARPLGPAIGVEAYSWKAVFDQLWPLYVNLNRA